MVPIIFSKSWMCQKPKTNLSLSHQLKHHLSNLCESKEYLNIYSSDIIYKLDHCCSSVFVFFFSPNPQCQCLSAHLTRSVTINSPHERTVSSCLRNTTVASCWSNWTMLTNLAVSKLRPRQLMPRIHQPYDMNAWLMYAGLHLTAQMFTFCKTKILQSLEIYLFCMFMVITMLEIFYHLAHVSLWCLMAFIYSFSNASFYNISFYFNIYFS